MHYALKARHYRFVKYLVSVGKQLDIHQIVMIVRKEGVRELAKFLSVVHP